MEKDGAVVEVGELPTYVGVEVVGASEYLLVVLPLTLKLDVRKTSTGRQLCNEFFSTKITWKNSFKETSTEEQQEDSLGRRTA